MKKAIKIIFFVFGVFIVILLIFNLISVLSGRNKSKIVYPEKQQTQIIKMNEDEVSINYNRTISEIINGPAGEFINSRWFFIALIMPAIFVLFNTIGRVMRGGIKMVEKIEEIIMPMDENIAYNFVMDLRKKDVDKFKRVQVIKWLMKMSNMTEREFAKEIGVPRSTLNDWILFEQVTKDEYEVMKSKGLTDKHIHSLLRDKDHKEKRDFSNETKFNCEIKTITRDMRFYFKNFDKEMFNGNTEALLSELVGILGRLRMKVAEVTTGK